MSSDPQTPTAAGFIGRVSTYVADALRYWEPRRLIYNGILVAVVAVDLAINWTVTHEVPKFDAFLFLFFLAVLANVCYCAVYAVDLFVRFSGLEAAWKKGRVVVLWVGTAFAGVIAHFFALIIALPH